MHIDGIFIKLKMPFSNYVFLLFVIYNLFLFLFIFIKNK